MPSKYLLIEYYIHVVFNFVKSFHWQYFFLPNGLMTVVLNEYQINNDPRNNCSIFNKTHLF